MVKLVATYQTAAMPRNEADEGAVAVGALARQARG